MFNLGDKNEYPRLELHFKMPLKISPTVLDETFDISSRRRQLQVREWFQLGNPVIRVKSDIPL